MAGDPLPQLHDPDPLVARGVGLLRRERLGEGERIVVLLPNHPATFGLLLAACLEGVVAVPLPADLPDGEVAEIVADADPAVVLATPGRTESLTGTLEHLGVRVVGMDVTRLADEVRAHDPSASWPRTRPMAYTSGTTGRRKGVHVGVHDQAWGRRTIADEHEAFARRHGDRHLVVSPLYHSGPLRFAMVTALTGGRIAVLEGFTAERWREALRRLRPSSLFCVPTHLHRLLALREVCADDLASLGLLAHAAAPCPVPLKERVLELAPEGSVWEFYGATEGQFTVCPPATWREAPGTVGTARPGRRVEIRDDEGRVLPVGEVGTVWAHVPGHARFVYWRSPERTAGAWDGDAFTVGDLGHLDGQGRLTLAGRPGDLIITGGVNVYPAEVERRLLEVEGIAEAVVYGVPDDDWGERVEAAVVAWPDAEPDTEAVRAELAGRLAPPKVPKRVHVVDDLPRTATGKVRRDGSLPALSARDAGGRDVAGADR